MTSIEQCLRTEKTTYDYDRNVKARYKQLTKY